MIVAILVASVFPLCAKASSNTEVQTVLPNVSNSNWMSAIRGETRLTEITMPGTHDSCARKFKESYATSISKCQNLNITEQLDAGVRFLDVRCECDSSTLSVKTVHGSTHCWNGDDYYYLDFVFQDVYNWLSSHPSETVLISIKEDNGDVGAATFTRAIYEYIHGYGQGKYFYGESYNYHNQWYLSKAVPTLDEVRGKCVLMNRFDQVIETSGSGVDPNESGQKVKWLDFDDSDYKDPPFETKTNSYSNLTFHVQDYYKWSTSNKITATQYMLNLGHYRGEYYFNFSSTVSDSLIPNPENLADTVNAAYPNYTYTKTKPSGIYAMDFATSDLCRYIINCNDGVSTLYEGTDGNISFSLNRITHTLTISGSGAMNNYAYTSERGVNGMGSTAPWGDQLKNSVFDGQYNSDIITSIVVEEGVTSIGNYAFYGYDNVTSVTLPSTVTSIGEGAFTKCSSLEEININTTNTASIGTYAFKDCTSLRRFYTSSTVNSIEDNAFTNCPSLTMYGLADIYSQTFANSHSIPYVVFDFSTYSVNAKAGNTFKESENPFKNKNLSNGVTISFSKYCNSDEGWNTSLINFSTGNNSDNRYFIIMANGTVLFNDGNGGRYGNNGCYFDINSTVETNSTSPSWVDVDITIFKDNSSNHILKYYINKTLVKTVNLNNICAWGYPNGVSGNDGIFSFLRNEDINLYYGASFSTYPNMAGTAESYLDKVTFTPWAKSDKTITKTETALYSNTFTDSLGGTPVTGWDDGGKAVILDTSNNDGRQGTAFFPYTQNGGEYANYVITNESPFNNVDTSNGLTVSFWQRVNGNYFANLESLTFAQGDIGEMKYFTVGTDGYIRFNNGNGGSDPSLSGAGLYFDYTNAEASIVKQQWQFITLEIIDDFHFKLYVNGELKNNITVSGTENYNNAGGLTAFLRSGNTKLYLGAYTPYWGTCTLSLDNVSCFGKALTSSEVYDLYMNEIKYDNSFVNAFNAAPQIHSGETAHLKTFSGRKGVIKLYGGSADSDIQILADGDTVSDTSNLPSNSEITVNYNGNKNVSEWIVDNDGVISTVSAVSNSYTFTLNSDTYVYCVLENEAAADYSAFNAAVDYANTLDGEDYSQESFLNLTTALDNYSDIAESSPSQVEVDNATFDILSAISALAPYLNLNASAENGNISVTFDNENHSAGNYSVLFGTEISLNAEPANNYRFLGWYETKTKRIFSTDTNYTFKITSNTDIVPLYVNYSSVMLTAYNDTNQVQKFVVKSVEEWNEVDDLTPVLGSVPYKLGYSAGYWADMQQVLSSLKSGNDASIYPAYENSGYTPPTVPVPFDSEPAAELSYYYNQDVSTASFTMALGVPEGCHIESIGIALYYKKASAFNPQNFILTLNNKMLTSKFEASDEGGIYTVNISKFSSKYNWSVRGYATYYDENSNLKTAYTNQINIVDKTIV